jgi:hypothetical protein
VQDAEELCTAEEAEADKPLLRAKIQEHLGDVLKQQKLKVDDVLNSAEGLKQLANHLFTKGEKLMKDAGASSESLQADLVRPLLLPLLCTPVSLIQFPLSVIVCPVSMTSFCTAGFDLLHF